MATNLAYQKPYPILDPERMKGRDDKDFIVDVANQVITDIGEITEIAKLIKEKIVDKHFYLWYA